MSIKIISENKKSFFDFHISERMEAGLVLQGSEVKALRQGQVTLKDSYIILKNGEAYLQNAHISPYKASSYNNHEPERLRKLLLHKNELDRLNEAIQEKGMTIVPTRIYFKNGRIKLEIGLAKGKTKGDKRASSREKEAKMEIQKNVRRSRGN